MTAIASVLLGSAWQRGRVHYVDFEIMPTWLRERLAPARCREQARRRYP